MKTAEESRFAFGENWRSFLETLDDQRIDQATKSLASLLRLDSVSQPLAGKTFLDVGCGSGLFSLAATRLGATVTSIDYDPQCVACTGELRERFGAGGPTWYVRQGSVLDEAMMESLGGFDVVYSWGVLHHTGEMNRAIHNAAGRVNAAGHLAVAIYNDQGGASRRWHWIKRTYNRLPSVLRPAWVVLIAGFYECKFAAARALRAKSPLPFADWRAKKADRGMSVWHDWVDWIGGLPFEVAKPEDIAIPLIDQGFRLINLKTVGNGWGCNEYVFRQAGDS
ncbi:MAG: methyltransferase domain-containing protein [Planctomycetota bacterium]